MSEARRPQSRFYDGSIYATVMDRFGRGLHRLVAEEVGPRARVLDVGCGTGSVALRLASVADEVIGVELSPAMVDFATRAATAARAKNVRFVLGDVTEALAHLPDGHFDLATMVLVLHEMPAEARGPVLREVTRVARALLCVDFRVPMPKNGAGLRNRLFELAAGLEHFQAFRDFCARGGISEIAATAGLHYHHLRFVDAHTLDFAEVSRRTTP